MQIERDHREHETQEPFVALAAGSAIYRLQTAMVTPSRPYSNMKSAVNALQTDSDTRSSSRRKGHCGDAYHLADAFPLHPFQGQVVAATHNEGALTADAPDCVRNPCR